MRIPAIDKRQWLDPTRANTKRADVFGTSDRCQVLPAIRHKIPMLEPADIKRSHRGIRKNSGYMQKTHYMQQILGARPEQPRIIGKGSIRGKES